MKHIISSNKSVKEVVENIKEIAPSLKFSVLGGHDIQNTLQTKGFTLENECQVLDICSAVKAHELLTTDMNISMVLPCKISVYTNNDMTHISMINISKLAPMINEKFTKISKVIEDDLKKLIQQAK